MANNTFSGSQRQPAGGILSIINSSELILTAGSTFTGESEFNNYHSVLVWVVTDQEGTLYVEFSVDGENWDTSLNFNYQTDRINPPHIFEKGSRYFRVRFTNDSASDQTYFRLSVSYGNFNKLTSPINGTLAESYDALVVRPTDYKYEVAMSKRQGRTTVNNFGHNLDVDIGAFEIIASFGGAFDPTTDIITSAQTFTITYNNTTDGLGQTGALSLLFTYIDENFLSKTSIHTLGNTGSDVTSFEGLGINRCLVFSNGGLGYNANDITITATIDGTTQAQIPAEDSVTQQLIYHTQINHNLLMDYWQINTRRLTTGGTDIRYTVKIYSWSRVTLTRYEVYRFDGTTRLLTDISELPSQPLIFGGREVIWFEAETDTNNTIFNGRFSGIEERVT